MLSVVSNHLTLKSGCFDEEYLEITKGFVVCYIGGANDDTASFKIGV